MMQRFYDAHLYLANWGSHRIMLRLPRTLLDPKIAGQYCVDGQVSMSTTRDHVIRSSFHIAAGRNQNQCSEPRKRVTPGPRGCLPGHAVSAAASQLRRIRRAGPGSPASERPRPRGA
jgi:hypothetical protein